MPKLINHISPALSVACFLAMIAGIETSPWYGLLVIPFAVFMYIGGGCYGCFYPRERRDRK